MALDRDAHIVWYGHACVEIRTPGGKTVIVDPWFTNPKSPKAPDAVNRCDLLLVTHGHSDHFGDALQIASRTHPTWPMIHELSLWVPRQLSTGDQGIVGFNKGGTVAVGDIKVSMTGAEHSAGAWSDAVGIPMYLGEPAGFVIELEDGYRIYHAGDTNVFGDMRLIGELYRPDLAILPIGGHYTMGPREAAYAVEMLGVGDVMPIHYGTFPILAGTPDQLRDELSKRGVKAEVHAVEPGGEIS